jgi:hypothetical protein
LAWPHFNLVLRCGHVFHGACLRREVCQGDFTGKGAPCPECAVDLGQCLAGPVTYERQTTQVADVPRQLDRPLQSHFEQVQDHLNHHGSAGINSFGFTYRHGELHLFDCTGVIPGRVRYEGNFVRREGLGSTALDSPGKQSPLLAALSGPESIRYEQAKRAEEQETLFLYGLFPPDFDEFSNLARRQGSFEIPR